MLIRDIDKKLDMRLVLKVRQSTELFRATSELGMKLPAYVYGVDGTAWISTYFPKNIKGNSVSLLLNKFNALEKDESYVVDSRINNVEDLAVINKLMDLPSFVINRADISRGFLNIYSRFHSSDLEKVSDLLAEYTSDLENSRVEWMGPSPGIMRIMDLINSEYPVSIVTYEFSLDIDDNDISTLAKDPRIIAELKNSESRDGELKLVVYYENPEPLDIPGMRPISPYEGIYGLSFSSAFVSSVRDAANREHIMRLRYFIKPFDGKMRVSVFLPSASMYEYNSILYEMARKRDHNVTIRYLLPYSQDLWDFL
jgi:hypothetical protein